MNGVIIPSGNFVTKLGKGTHTISGTFPCLGNGAGTAVTIFPNIKVEEGLTVSSITATTITPIKYDGTTLAGSSLIASVAHDNLNLACTCSIGTRCMGMVGIQATLVLA